MRRILWILLALMTSLFVGPLVLVSSNSRAMAAQSNSVEGLIKKFECGDNCYLTITDDKNAEIDGLCSAKACQPWNAAAEIPNKLIGKRVRVLTDIGIQFDSGGKARGKMRRFRELVVLSEPEKLLGTKTGNSIANNLPLTVRDLPSEVEKTAKDLVAECKEAGEDVDGNLDKTLEVHQLGNGRRLALFDPKRICAFKGNSVCSTDGCDVSIYVEHAAQSWALATKQTVLSDTVVEDANGSTPLKAVLSLRGGNPPCKRSPQSTCIFELTWKGLNFDWKQLR